MRDTPSVVVVVALVFFALVGAVDAMLWICHLVAHLRYVP